MGTQHDRACRLGALAGLALAGLALTGCAKAPPPLYGWGSYQGQVYEYLSKGPAVSPEQQALALEADLEKMNARGAMPAPGYHAHLGLLYSAMGKDDQAAQQLLAEKRLFPESAQYIDFLLASKGRK